MLSINFKDFEAFEQRLEDTLKHFPDMRREMFEELGKEGEETVRSAVGGSGKVQGWQEARVGTGGGYAAVSAKRGKLPANDKGKEYAYGYVTNAINSGHKIRPSGAGSRYRFRGKQGYVHGKRFYESARADMEAKAAGKVEDLLKKVEEMIGGGE